MKSKKFFVTKIIEMQGMDPEEEDYEPYYKMSIVELLTMINGLKNLDHQQSFMSRCGASSDI